MIKIADVSHHQGEIDWDRARKKLDFAILRASCGTAKDTRFARNVQNCDLPYAVYHYVKAGTREEAEMEAAHFVQVVQAAGAEPCFWIGDIEYKQAQTSETTEAVCVAFLEKLKALGCKRVGLYINTLYGYAKSAIGLCDVMWIPHWGQNTGELPEDRYMPKHPFDLWQYTSRGRVDGIRGNVDLSTTNGKSLEWLMHGDEEGDTMPEETLDTRPREEIPFTGEHFIKYLHTYMQGMPYWWGTCLYKCTKDLLKRKAARYPNNYGKRMAKCEQSVRDKQICSDCIGAVKGYMWSNAGEGVIPAIGTDLDVKNSYGSHGCPDYGTETMFNWAKQKGMAWGTIDTIPEVVGLAVTMRGHVGYYMGDGMVCEFTGSVGYREIAIDKGNKWTEWYALPFLDYGEAEVRGKDGKVLGCRVLKKGSKGSDVETLQKILVDLGYSLGKYGPKGDGVDGSYGAAVEKAVRQLQGRLMIASDGVYGSQTHKALMDYLDQQDTAERQQEEEEEPVVEPEQEDEDKVCVTAAEAGVYAGNGLEFALLTLVHEGDTFPYVATAAKNGWLAVLIGGDIGWIDGAFALAEGR